MVVGSGVLLRDLASRHAAPFGQNLPLLGDGGDLAATVTALAQAARQELDDDPWVELDRIAQHLKRTISTDVAVALHGEVAIATVLASEVGQEKDTSERV